MKKIAVLAAAATIAGIGFAGAQTGTGTTTVDPNKCWDVSSNSIKDKPMGSTTGSAASGSATSGATAGSTPSGSPGSTAGSAGTATGTSGSSTAAARPAGMPSC